jgi:hypothetical protein
MSAPWKRVAHHTMPSGARQRDDPPPSPLRSTADHFATPATLRFAPFSVYGFTCIANCVAGPRLIRRRISARSDGPKNGESASISARWPSSQT